MFDDDITAASAMAYHAYKLNVEQSGGHYSKDIIHDQNHWLKIARLALANNMNPARFVNAQFCMLDDARKRTMTPRLLYTPVSRALSAYAATAPTPCDYHKIYDCLDYNVRSLAARRHVDPLTIVSDPEQMFPPWFRILYAPVLTKELEENYLEYALSEIAEDVDLQKYIKEEDTNGRFPNTYNQHKYVQ